jgi:DNA-binding LytR/AlgR family response regulator
MTALRVAVIDDEPLAIERLRDLLGRSSGVEIAATYLSPAKALNDLPAVLPDLVLVDVEMPKMDGFDFVEALAKQDWVDAQSAPYICFVTAYPQFASAAFDTGALDFLCKPVRLTRLEITLDRARMAIERRDALGRLNELTTQLDALRRSGAGEPQPALWVQQRGQMVRVPLEEMEWINAEGEYVRLHLEDRSFLLRNSVSGLAEKLSNHRFVRIHRGTIINEARLAGIRSTRNKVEAIMVSGACLAVGRKYRPAIRSLQREIAQDSLSPGC